MEFELKPLTAPGARFVALAEEHAIDFAARADQHDREGELSARKHGSAQEERRPDRLRARRIRGSRAGVGARLRRRNEPTRTRRRINGHCGEHAHLPSLAVRPPPEGRPCCGAPGRLGTVGGPPAPDRLGRGRDLCAHLRGGTDVLHPLVEATRTDGGWLLNGTKIFGTGSPAANLFNVAYRVKDAAGGARRALALVPRGAPGLEIKGNWDALGMRGSGSHDVVFTDCFVPDGEPVDTGPWGNGARDSSVAIRSSPWGSWGSSLASGSRLGS